MATQMLGDGSAITFSKGDRPSLPIIINRFVRTALNTVLFPDLRIELYPFALSKLKSLIDQYSFDVVVSSHEPGVDLILGLWCKKRQNLPWVIDLGDPPLAAYTPSWRRRLDFAFESRVLERSDRITVTTDRVRDLLCTRHDGTSYSKIITIPQGYPDMSLDYKSGKNLLPINKLNIVFTGTFYRDFRSPERLALALHTLQANDMTLTIAGTNIAFSSMFKDIPNVRFLGRIDHFTCLEIQRQADLLMNIGNIQAYQLPGKIYEYLGSGTPILHIKTGPDDPGAELVERMRAGEVVDNDTEIISGSLTRLLHRWRNGEPVIAIDPDHEAISQYSWSQRSEAYYQLLAGLQ